MPRVEVNFGDQLLTSIEKDVAALPKEFRAEYKRRTRNPVRNLKRRIAREPSRQPTHPFIWSFDTGAQARARGWWFAAIAGKIPGVSIPTDGNRYKRTGKGVEGIQVVFDRPMDTIAVDIADESFYNYVVGPRQVPSHQRTGWKRIDLEIERAEVEFLDNAIAVWDDLTNKVGE